MTQEMPPVKPKSEPIRINKIVALLLLVCILIPMWFSPGTITTAVHDVWRYLIGSEDPPPTPAGDYHCDNCGNEFEYGTPIDVQMGPTPIRCSKCATVSAWLMNRCYRCKKLFAAKPEEHKRDYDGSKTVCPHCNTNQIDYLKETLKK